MVELAQRIVHIEQVRRGPVRLPSETELAAMLMLYTVEEVLDKYSLDAPRKQLIMQRINDLMARPLVPL